MSGDREGEKVVQRVVLLAVADLASGKSKVEVVDEMVASSVQRAVADLIAAKGEQLLFSIRRYMKV
jgi:hypothetical protein